MWNLPASLPKRYGREEERRVRWPRNKGNFQVVKAAPVIEPNDGKRQRTVKRRVMKKQTSDNNDDDDQEAIRILLARKNQERK